MSTAIKSFETTVEVCCHQVAIRYWDFDAKLTDENYVEMTERFQSPETEANRDLLRTVARENTLYRILRPATFASD